MQIKNTTDRYGVVSKLLHWVVAFCVLGMLLVGSLLDVLAGPTQGAVYGWHKSLGITLLALMIVFMLWSARNVKPSYPAGMPFSQLALAKVVRYLLYISVTAMCLSGWIFTTAKGNPPILWGWFNLPAIGSSGSLTFSGFPSSNYWQYQPRVSTEQQNGTFVYCDNRKTGNDWRLVISKTGRYRVDQTRDERC